MPSTSFRLAVLAAILAGFASAAGLAVPGLYRDAPNWVQQAQGTDIATLLLAVPLTAVGLWSAARGAAAGGLAVVAGLLYLVYNYAIFAFAVAMNPLTLVHIAIFGLCLWSLLVGGREVVDAGASTADHLHRRTSAGLLVVVAVMFGLLWVSQIARTGATGALPADVAKAGMATNPVYALDLGFFLPLCMVAGVALARRTAIRGVAFSMLIWASLMGAGVVGGFAMMAAAGDADAVPIAVGVTILSIVSGMLAAAALLQRRGATDRALRGTSAARARG